MLSYSCMDHKFTGPHACELSMGKRQPNPRAQQPGRHRKLQAAPVHRSRYIRRYPSLGNRLPTPRSRRTPRATGRDSATRAVPPSRPGPSNSRIRRSASPARPRPLQVAIAAYLWVRGSSSLQPTLPCCGLRKRWRNESRSTPSCCTHPVCSFHRNTCSCWTRRVAAVARGPAPASGSLGAWRLCCDDGRVGDRPRPNTTQGNRFMKRLQRLVMKLGTTASRPLPFSLSLSPSQYSRISL
mmetsp:Transcript_28466/g.64455  ORF Transcript_28466/g.64455 Transcript_28466/m.64455 type:complete len:240 (+) Transcript_28466:106-825(+)